MNFFWLASITVQRLAVRSFIRKFNQSHQTTVILTTHDMQDIEALTNRILLIGKGRILMDGTLDTMKQMVPDTNASLDEIVAKLYQTYHI